MNLPNFIVAEKRRLAGSGMRGMADSELMLLCEAVKKFAGQNTVSFWMA